MRLISALGDFMVIWLIGAIFTLGFTDKDKAGFWESTLVFFMWPFILGMAIRDYIERQSPNKQNKPDPNKADRMGK